ncbi:sugar-binding domain-containing protein [Flavobacterium sp. LB1P62]|uniref:sugar-binding domain-containing protein n=1 Tax=Flavobacterium sp. LB1P62 TaxID=3401715 RepID=UPI003AAFBE19
MAICFGHPFDTAKDFNNGVGYFSYLAKTTYGDGAGTTDFDDRSWRKLDLPHDWAVEQGFSKEASYSHGFKNIGRLFPETSVGWYRKKINIPEGDLGRRIHIAFDGVFRNSIVWFNGHYLGTNPSGYLGFEYQLSFLADREFVGEKWVEFLNDYRIGYHIRIRNNFMVYSHRKQKETPAFRLLNNLKTNYFCHYPKIVRLHGQDCYLSGSKTINRERKMEFLIIVY